MTVPAGSEAKPEQTAVAVRLLPSNVWRTGFAAAAVVAVVLFLRFVLNDAGSFVFTLIMAWFFSLAMEPSVRYLARYMPRGVATASVMVALGLFGLVFLVLFGQLLVEQVAALIRSLPDMAQALMDWVNRQFGTSYSVEDILESVRLTPDQAADYAQELLGGALSVIGTVVFSIFNTFTLLLLTFYLSADGPRLRLWLAGLLPARSQRLFATVWDLTTLKTGGYVAARVVLAAINGATSAIVFLIIGMPSWLALGVWTGVVAQFVPTIGTYIAIALPVIVGLLSPEPWIGVAALIWAVVYQQVENLTIEPRISGRAVNLHPGVAFSAAVLGGYLFGAAGALLGIPVMAMLLALLDIYATRHELLPDLTGRQAGSSAGAAVEAAGPGPDPAAPQPRA